MRKMKMNNEKDKFQKENLKNEKEKTETWQF